VKAGRNILVRGREMRAGEEVLKAGTLIRPQEIGVLATVGRAQVRAVPRPTIAVLPTGDEIVEVDQKPRPGQIRNGNGPTLMALVQRAGGTPKYLGIALDRLDSLRPFIEDGLRSDVLVLCGGVSAGKLDLVPGVLQELGVEAHFHKVEMKPGKPIFFGTRGNTLVFGLPGNPVSSFVCFELFVRPAMRILRGSPAAAAKLESAPLAEDFAYRTDRPTYHPAWLQATRKGWQVNVVPWFGSPDLRGLLSCNCFVVFPAGDHRHKAGQEFPFLHMQEMD
jgi:molybdopterin molybdotransferase